MVFAELNLRVLYVLLQSDWFAQNLELEPLNPGLSAQTNLSFSLPAKFRTRMHILGKIRLARKSRVRACLFVRPFIVGVRACDYLYVCSFVCVFVSMFSCMNKFLCLCIRVSVCTYVFLHECVFVCVYSFVNVCS